MKTEVNLKQVRYDAEEVFRIGGFFCSEAIVSSVRKNIDPKMPEALISSASGFPVGVGRSKCMCGAISGGVIAIGYFFGENEPQKCKSLSYELQESFRKNHNETLCCHIHTKGMDMASGEHKQQCVAFTGEMAVKTAELIVRELGLKPLYNEVEVR